MAQFYTKERTVSSAAPKIFDNSDRILKEAENLIESMRAVSSIEERQNAALINNLRTQRQREKETNTRNHQMLMDNLRQVAEVEERNARTNQANNALEAKEKAAQEARTMQTLGSLSKLAGQAATSMVEQGISQLEEQARLEALDLSQRQFELNPQGNAGEGFGLDAQLNQEAQASTAQSVSAYLAKDSGKDLNFVARMFVRPDRIQRIRRQTLVGELSKKITRGGIEDYIRQNPNDTVTIGADNQVVPLSDVLQGKIQSSEQLNRVYSELAHKMLKEAKGDADPALFFKSDELVRNYINGRVLSFSDKLDRDAIKEYGQTKLDHLLLGESSEQIATNSIQFIDGEGVNPFSDRSTALNQITNKILPNVDNPVAYAEALGEKEFRHMPGVPIKDTPFGTELLREAYRLEEQKQKQYIETSKAQGQRIGGDIFKASFSNDQLFDLAEYSKGYEAIREKEQNGTISHETARAAESFLDTKYQNYSDSKLVKEQIAHLSGNLDLDQDTLDNAFRNGQIDRTTYDTETQKLEELTAIKLPNGERFSKRSVRTQMLTLATSTLDKDAIPGQAKSETVVAVADELYDRVTVAYASLSKEFADRDLAMDKAIASAKAYFLNNIGEGGEYQMIDQGEQRHYKKYRVDATGSKLLPAASTRPAQEVGNELRGDGAIRLDDPNYKVIDVNVPVYQKQIESGKKLKPSARDQAIADAAGIPFHELVNRRFKALGIDAEATEGSFGIIRKASQVSPELQRVIDSPKTWNKLSSVTDRSPQLMPARMGNQSLGFHNATSIARKFGHPNPELIGALWSLQTNDGSQQPDMTPAQQITQIIDNNPNLNMFIPYAEVASSLPEAIPIMRKYGDSHNSFSGGSKTISRLQYTLVGMPTRLSRAIIGKESSGNSSATNTDSGALGYGQVMPSNVPSWTKEAFGYSMSPQQFLDDPRAQVKVVNFKLQQYYDKAISEGASPDVAVRKAAAAWYAGPGNTHLIDNDKPQYSNGNEYPSIRSYTLDILRRYNNE